MTRKPTSKDIIKPTNTGYKEPDDNLTICELVKLLIQIVKDLAKGTYIFFTCKERKCNLKQSKN